MIESVSGQFAGQFPFNPNQELTEEQIAQVRDTLSSYDVENLSDEDRQAIRAELREAGIPPGPALFKELRAAGFSFGERQGLTETDSLLGGAGRVPQLLDYLNDNQERNERVKAFQELLSRLDLGNLTEEEQESIKESLEAMGMSLRENFLDLEA